MQAAWRAFGLNVATTGGGGGSMSLAGRQTMYTDIIYVAGVCPSGAEALNFDMMCGEGVTPPVGSDFQVVGELRDANGAQMDVYTDEWNWSSEGHHDRHEWRDVRTRRYNYHAKP